MGNEKPNENAFEKVSHGKQPLKRYVTYFYVTAYVVSKLAIGFK